MPAALSSSRARHPASTSLTDDDGEREEREASMGEVRVGRRARAAIARETRKSGSDGVRGFL